MIRVLLIWFLLTAFFTLGISTWKSWRLKTAFEIAKWVWLGVVGATITTVILIAIYLLF